MSSTVIMPPKPPGIFGALILAAASLINGHLDRKRAKERFDEQKQHDFVILDREHEFAERSAIKRTRDEILQKYVDADIRYKLDRGGMPFPPGSYRDFVGLCGKEPYVIFSSPLRQDHSQQDQYLGYNPIADLYRRFVETASDFSTPHDTHLSFLAEDEARVFIRQEFPEQAVVLVYGDYLGHELNIRATFNGMRRDQFTVFADGDVRLKALEPRTVFLGRLPQPALQQSAVLRDNEVLLYDLIVNVWLQMLIDSYYMFHPERAYTPNAHAALIARMATLESLHHEDVFAQLSSITAASDKSVHETRTELALTRSGRF